MSARMSAVPSYNIHNKNNLIELELSTVALKT